MHTGGIATTTRFGSLPRPVICRVSRRPSDQSLAVAGLVCTALLGVALVRSMLTWQTALTALTLMACGLAQTEIARYQARRAEAPWVAGTAVWVIGAAALRLPLGVVLVVSSVLVARELLCGPRGGALVRSLAATSGAALAWLAASVTTGALAAGLAGLVYIVTTEGTVLSRNARRLVAGTRPGDYDESSDIAARTALGVLLGTLAPVSLLVVPLVLLPASYLQRAARGRALRHAAEHDPKTHLLNHAAWQTLSSAALASHRTPTHSAAVLMVDLDHFKRLNDTYGHQAGDDVLTCVAHVLQTSTRRNDIVARFGGEEFSILLPGVTEQEACQAAERIRDQIAALTVITTNLHGRPVTISGITASIGVATTREADDASVDDLLVNADRWLYQAKERGRNRVCGPELASAA